MAEANTTSASAYALEDANGPVKPGTNTTGTTTFRQSAHRCCGGCCDVRRAVVIVNSIQLFLLSFALITSSILLHVSRNPDQYSDMDGNGVTDDEMTEFYTEIGSVNWLFVCIRIVTGIFASLGGIYGAIQFRSIPIAICGVWYVVYAILALITLNEGDFVYYLFFAYPHYFLFQEIRQGIMTKENYPNVEQSCCCV